MTGGNEGAIDGGKFIGIEHELVFEDAVVFGSGYLANIGIIPLLAGKPDLVVIDEQTGPAVFWGRPDGTYSEAEPLGGSEATPYAITVADVDRNGRPDVIVGYVESRPIVFFNDGADSFVGAPFGDAEGTAYGFAVGDLDEDGFLDIAMARSGARNMLYFGAAP